MREDYEDCETCVESYGEKWGRLRKQLRSSIVWENRKDKIGDPASYWLYTVIKMMNNIEYGDGELEER